MPAETPADGEPEHLVIAVVRTGGIAGLRRRWRAEPPPAQTPQWKTLVERCPWNDDAENPPGDDMPGADRYVWTIHVRVNASERDEQLEQVVPDSHLRGPWRDLVDAVRDADAGRGVDARG
ncbi:hypothetical protein JF531_08975 [Microbacterium esteraromaticum]|uniref:protealysin inhibitor emfourin n=1 Tax=Microbacterium esteraromaticum TaxID=57043 RepID=UPI0015C7BAF6|nr:protealysin inhibitor emfourin [Microbacterium esteraromaticum]MBN8424652.1 hypothetical protein [Microbacterium esteraromaticum]